MSKPLTKADLQTILDHVTKERRNVENYIDEKLSQVNTDVESIAAYLGFERDSKGCLQKPTNQND